MNRVYVATNVLAQLTIAMPSSMVGDLGYSIYLLLSGDAFAPHQLKSIKQKN
ncbi:hypothetical protein GLIP_3654 [Aliiglaciecola lipolytica E3]|uniref:Uncharacterized protein n=1 Tax=Aliiglaciecola lipolytica E3 TaxID=1127673 RepID=K6YYG8_9ALTE|nr:hypothetical protein GLIP_3654 [Aliiglaciecola lipolytica E3]